MRLLMQEMIDKLEAKVDKRFDSLEAKIDNHQEILWKHINTDTKNFERLESEFRLLKNEQKWFQKIALGIASIIGAMITWFIEGRRHG